MFDPRIYRTGLIAVLVAVIVVAFSLTNQSGPLVTNLAPQAFNGQNAYLDMVGLAHKYPDLRPGSAGDDALAQAVATALRKDHFSVSTQTYRAHTADGTRTLRTVVGTLAGTTAASPIVVMTHRDAAGRPTPADLSGTAVLLELARVLSGETQQRSVVLASTSGSVGTAGAAQLARSLGSPVDAVIALGDMASTEVRDPIIVPWSDGQQTAPPLLRKTVAAALASQAGVQAQDPGFASQFAHLAFPLAVTDQGPFGAQGDPAVLVSLSGEDPPGSAQTTNPNRITGMGSAVLQAVDSLDAGPSAPAPGAYLLFSGKVLPAWAVKLMVLALIVPVLMTMVDGLARARRRGHPILRWLLWVIAAAVPFVLAVLIVLAAKLVGLFSATPPDPALGGAVPLGGAGVVVMVLGGIAIVGLLLARRPLIGMLIGERSVGRLANEGAGAAVMLVLCVMALVIWERNAFAAALMIPALHLWMWVLDPDVRLPRPVTAALVLIGIAPPALLVLYYMNTLGLDPVQAAWGSVLLVAGGYIGILTAVQWSLVLACLVSVISIAVRRPRVRRTRPEETPVTVRGPITYAGPGSLGGTKSALRR